MERVKIHGDLLKLKESWVYEVITKVIWLNLVKMNSSFMCYESGWVYVDVDNSCIDDDKSEVWLSCYVLVIFEKMGHKRRSLILMILNGLMKFFSCVRVFRVFVLNQKFWV